MCVRVSVGVGGGGGGFVVVVRGGVYIQIHETSEATINFLLKTTVQQTHGASEATLNFLLKNLTTMTG